MVFIMAVNMNNAAFDEDASRELGRILGELSDKLKNGRDIPFRLKDLNGNIVGKADYVKKAPKALQL